MFSIVNIQLMYSFSGVQLFKDKRLLVVRNNDITLYRNCMPDIETKKHVTLAL